MVNITVLLKYLCRSSTGWPVNIMYSGCTNANWVKFRSTYGRRY